MNRWMTLLCAAVVALSGLTLALAEPEGEEPAAPAAEARAERQSPPQADDAAEPQPQRQDARPKARVHGQYRKLDLTAEQTQQIAAIQQATEQKVKQLKEQERQQIERVLTGEQLTELQRQQAKREARFRIAGYKGYLKRLENQRKQVGRQLDQARAAGDQQKVGQLEAQLDQIDQRSAEARRRMEAIEAEFAEPTVTPAAD